MSNRADLISDLLQRDVKLWISGGQLRLKEPKG
jgi:hypothetical protein